MKKNKLVGIVALTAMMGLSGCNIGLGESCIHKWSAWEVTEESTCRDKGQRTRYCLLCDKEQVRSMPIDTMYGHKYVENEDADVEATCETNGITGSQKCILCGQKKRGTSTPLTGHKWIKGTPTADETQYHDATCTESGLSKMTCRVCGQSEGEVIAPKGHEESISNNTGALHEIRCIRPGCTTPLLGYKLLISEATGYSNPRTQMNSVNGTYSMSTWNIEEAVGTIIEPGFYDIELEAAMFNSNQSSKKMYNMANVNLQVDNDAATNASSDSPDTITQSDYRYYVQVNTNDVYNPTTKKSYGQLGLSGSGATNFKYIEFVNGVQIDSNTKTISLRHGNIGGALYCNSLKLIRHDHASKDETRGTTDGNGNVQYTFEQCDCGYRRVMFNAVDGLISGGKTNAGSNGYLQLPDNNDSITYKFSSKENVVGKLYAIGKQDASKLETSPYGCSCKVNDEEIIDSEFSGKTAKDLLDGDGNVRMLLGNVTLKDENFQANEIKYTRLNGDNIQIIKFVFEGRPAGHLHKFVRDAENDKAGTCLTNKQEHYVCDCGKDEYREVENSKADHKYNNNTWRTNPNCEDYGELEHVCSVCGKNWREYTPKDHSLGEGSKPAGMNYVNKLCTQCSEGGQAEWTLTKDMIETSSDRNDWASNTEDPIVGKAANGSTNLELFKFDNTKYRRVVLEFQNDTGASDGVLSFFGTTKLNEVSSCQPFRQSIGEESEKVKFNVFVKYEGSSDRDASYGRKCDDINMHDLGVQATASQTNDNGAILADPVWLNYCVVTLKAGLNRIVFETPELSNYPVYIGGFRLSY